MAFSKAHRFHPADYHYSLICKALSHPARISILRILYEHGKCEVKQLLNTIPLHRDTVSQHLRILREMHVINAEQKYPTVIYWLNEDLPATYRTVIDLLIRAGTHFNPNQPLELQLVGRTSQPSALGI